MAEPQKQTPRELATLWVEKIEPMLGDVTEAWRLYLLEKYAARFARDVLSLTDA